MIRQYDGECPICHCIEGMHEALERENAGYRDEPSEEIIGTLRAELAVCRKEAFAAGKLDGLREAALFAQKHEGDCWVCKQTRVEMDLRIAALAIPASEGKT